MLRVHNTGCGVQSTAIQLMSLHGELPRPDAYVFADTGDEPDAVYAWAVELRRLAERAGIRWIVARRSGPSISDHMRRRIGAGVRSESIVIPAFAGAPGAAAPLNRSCTRDWKVRPIEAAVKAQLLGLSPGAHWPRTLAVETWLGISGDEMERMKCGVAPWQRFWHPLIEEPWTDGPAPVALLRPRVLTRDDCLQWIRDHGYPEPPRSACVFCPFHSNVEWRRIRADADAWARAIAMDHLLRSRPDALAGCLRTPAFLHRSLVPLDAAPIDGIAGQTSFLEECAGVCGV